jgi:hypothetical protein
MASIYLNEEIQKDLKRKFDLWAKKQLNKPTGKEIEQIRKLERRALVLWKQVVKLFAHGKCESPGCKKTKHLNAHHIEGYTTNKALRYDSNNGILLCSTHHKFGRQSAHKSFVFMHLIMSGRPIQLNYLISEYNAKCSLTIERLEDIIHDLETRLKPTLNKRKPHAQTD